MDWIGDKHKLASDIMNYARRQLEKVGINRPITIDDKEGVVTKIYKLQTGIVLVYIDFDKPNPHWKIYTIEEVIKVVGSSGAGFTSTKLGKDCTDCQKQKTVQN